MRVFEELQARHEALLAQQAEDANILDEVQRYLNEVRQKSSQVVAPAERDQLRANLRYWSGYVYEKTGAYPSVDLAPADATARLATPTRWPIGLFVVAGVILVAVLAFGSALLFSSGIGQGNGGNTQTPGSVVVSTATATPLPSATATPTPAATATVTPTPPCRPSAPSGWVAYTVQAGDTLVALASRTGVAVPEIVKANCLEGTLIVGGTIFLPQPPPTPTPDIAGIVVQLNSLQDGDEVSPRTRLSGNYRNLRPGWSIHVLLQPISQGGRLFPLAPYTVVPIGMAVGEWSIEAEFGEGSALEKPEQYNIRLAAAVDDATRVLLESAVEDGFDEIPQEVVLFPQITTVSRGAYYPISEIRLVYALLIGELQNEIVTARPDGSDLRRITYSPLLVESDPNLSPDGRKIIFVRPELPETGFINTVWLMDSNGRNEVQVIGEEGADYERPVWSPDGRYIAYSATINRRFSQIFLYDTLTGDVEQVTDGAHNSRFPSWMPEGGSLVYSRHGGLYRLDLDSRESTLLFDEPIVEETHPVVSPDGTSVAYTVVFDPNSRTEIHVLDLETLESRAVTTNNIDLFPSWHPNGQSIYFETFRGTEPPIWAVDVDGNNLRPVSPGSSTAVSPHVGIMEAFLPLEPLNN